MPKQFRERVENIRPKIDWDKPSKMDKYVLNFSTMEEYNFSKDWPWGHLHAHEKWRDAQRTTLGGL